MKFFAVMFALVLATTSIAYAVEDELPPAKSPEDPADSGLGVTTIPTLEETVELNRQIIESNAASIVQLKRRVALLEGKCAELGCGCDPKSAEAAKVVKAKTTKLGTPRYVNGKLRACSNPNCTDPTCPNKVTEISNSHSSPVSYTTRSNITRTRTRTNCKDGVCRIYKY